MPTWRPATREEVQAIVAVHQLALGNEQRELFDQIRIEPRACQIERSGQLEAVFVVARVGEAVVFWEDVEEGFELTAPDADGVLRDYGASQFELRHVLSQVLDRLG